MIRAITIEREFGCGASEIATLVAGRLGWNLWDERLTQEIARLTEKHAGGGRAQKLRRYPLVHRLFQDFLRGAFEGGMAPSDRLHDAYARRIAAVSETAVNTALASGPSIIVGRGSQYFLRNRKDVFHVFLYATRDRKIRRLMARGASQDEAIDQVDTTDKARAAFIRQYIGLKWPEPYLYDGMFNTDRGGIVRGGDASALRERVRQREIAGRDRHIQTRCRA